MRLFSKKVASNPDTEKLLSISEAKYRALVEKLPAITYIVEVGFRIRPVYVSPQIVSILGYSQEEWMADPNLSYRLLHPDDRDRVMAEIMKNLPLGKPFSLVYRKIARNGKIVWFRNHADWLRNESGRTRRIQGVMLDITEQMAVQEELNRSDAIMKAVRIAGEEFLHAMSWRDVIDNVLSHIRAAADASRVYLAEFEDGPDNVGRIKQRHEVIADGLTFHSETSENTEDSFIPNQDFSRWMDSFRRGEPVLGHVADFPLEEQAILQRQGILCLVAVPIFVQGKLWGYIGVDACTNPRTWSSSEVDALKSATSMLAAAIDRERTLQALTISEANLLQAQKLESIGRLAGGVAHDFNNLLTSILGYANLVHDNLADRPQIQSDVRDIIHAGTRAADLTKQLLLFSRKQMAEIHPLDLNDSVRNLQQILQRTIGEDIAVYLELENALPKVSVNPAQAEQIIMNLVLNARDSMPRGGTLTIRTKTIVMDQDIRDHFPGAKESLYVLLAVRDTGCGMTDEVRRQIFEPFFTTKQLGHGVGLGLAIVYGTISQWGGFVDVKSKPGVGTEFLVYLPASVSTPEPIQPKSQEVTTAGTETILLVEDEELVRALITRILGDLGYKVHAASNAEEAILLFEKLSGEVDMVFSDVVMPGMSGVQMMSKLQEISQKFAVLYMTGFTDDALFRHGVEEGKVPVLFKPFKPKDLAIKVREILDRHAAKEI